MPKRDSTNRPSQPDETGSFRGEYKRLEREYALARSILAARHAKGMTKRQFAKAVGASKGKISRWERAEVIPRLEMLQRIADVTGIGFQIGIEPSVGAGDAPAASSDRKPATRKSSGRKSTAQRSTPRTSAQRKATRSRSGATKTTRGASSARSTPSRRKGATRRSS